MSEASAELKAGTPGYSAAELAAWAGGKWEPAPPRAVGGLCHDTRRLCPGQIYLALPGEQFDGHAFVQAAERQGAAGAVVAAGWARTTAAEFPLLRVEDPLRALGCMATAYRQRVGLHVIGITGSAGKTTVRALTARLLGACHPTACSVGNWNNQIGLPLSLLAMPPHVRTGVFELGTNHPGEITALAAVLQPAWGVVTNVGAGHIEFFGTEAAIAREKGALLAALPAGGVAFLDRDGTWFRYLRAVAPAALVTVSTRRDADYMLVRRSPGNREVIVRERGTGERFRCALGTGGEPQVVNLLLAIAVARRLGVSGATIEAEVGRMGDLPMRWQRETVGGVRVINDAYNANPLSMRAALEAFREEEIPGRRWLVLGGMRELGESAEAAHLDLGRELADGDWAGLIAVGPLAADLARGARAAGMAAERVHDAASTAEAARVLVGATAMGDGVLLKGSRGERLEDVLTLWRSENPKSD